MNTLHLVQFFNKKKTIKMYRTRYPVADGDDPLFLKVIHSAIQEVDLWKTKFSWVYNGQKCDFRMQIWVCGTNFCQKNKSRKHDNFSNPESVSKNTFSFFKKLCNFRTQNHIFAKYFVFIVPWIHLSRLTWSKAGLCVRNASGLFRSWTAFRTCSCTRTKFKFLIFSKKKKLRRKKLHVAVLFY